MAKRLERMLETALNQLKVEQRLRREGDIKLIDLELSLVNSEHALKSSEERFDLLEDLEKIDKSLLMRGEISCQQSLLMAKTSQKAPLMGVNTYLGMGM